MRWSYLQGQPDTELLMNMAAVIKSQSFPNTKSVDKVLEDAQHSGKLDLSNRNLYDFSKNFDSYDLVDTVEASKCLRICALLNTKNANC